MCGNINNNFSSPEGKRKNNSLCSFIERQISVVQFNAKTQLQNDVDTRGY